MFLSTRKGEAVPDYWGSETGTISIGGGVPSVELCGAQQKVAVYGPGGMTWIPRRGQSVLVLKSGSAGESPCIMGVGQQDGGELEPGELRLFSDNASITLRNNGRIELQGKILINGREIV